MGPLIKINVIFADEINRLPLSKKKIRDLISCVCDGEKVAHASITTIFVDREKITELNAQYLKHDYPTDVIAFPLHENGEAVDGEAYICVDTAFHQAAEYNVPFKEELIRLVVHGVLHLIGYDDKDQNARKRMLALGERYLNEFKNDTKHK
ncbi:rRNA maturation RNase YbeY [candidate division KSB1 bacterium]